MTVSAKADCRSCEHFRLTLPEPFSETDLRIPEVVEERMKWLESMNRREQKERDQVRRGHTTFSYEPWFFAWCAHHSVPAPEVVRPEDARRGDYRLTRVVNPNGDCGDFIKQAGGE